MNLIRYHLQHYAINSQLLRLFLFIPLWIAKKLRNRREKRLLRYYDQVVYGGNLIIDPSNFPGKFKVSATSDLAKRVIRDSTFEPELTALLARFSDIGGVVVNIGANIGFYSVFFAKQFPNIRKVVAIEPNPEAVDLLKWNIAELTSRTASNFCNCVSVNIPGRWNLHISPENPSFRPLGTSSIPGSPASPSSMCWWMLNHFRRRWVGKLRTYH